MNVPTDKMALLKKGRDDGSECCKGRVNVTLISLFIR